MPRLEGFIAPSLARCDLSHIEGGATNRILILDLITTMYSKNFHGSGLWKHGLLITLLFGFTVMLTGGFFLYRSRAPIPAQVVGPDGAVLFTAADIQTGQELFRKRDLMN